MGEYGPAPGRRRGYEAASGLRRADAVNGGRSGATLPAYDLLLRGGHVIAQEHIDAVMDVAIKNGQIAKVARASVRRRHQDH